MSITEQDLISQGFKVVGENSNGLKLYARKDALGGSSIVLHKVTQDGFSLGVEFIEIETVKILSSSDLIM